jgi:cell division protease FtsH
VAYNERNESGQYLGGSGYHEKSYSEATAEQIDKEILKLLDEAHTHATKIIETNREKVEQMTDLLMEFETLDRDDIKAIFDGDYNIEEKRGRLKEAKGPSAPPIEPPSPMINGVQPQPNSP